MRWLAVAFLLVSAVPLSAQESKVAIKVGKDKIDFMAGDDLITTYHTGGFAKPIFWPLNAPGNVPLTRSWPMDKNIEGESTDHIHQKSAWFCHGDVIPQGIELKHKIRGVDGVDFWSEAVGHGNMVVTQVGEPKVAGNKATVTTKNEWRTADDVKIMEETRIITLVDYGKSRLIVLDIDLVAVAAPITFGDTKEGAMGIRINDKIRADNKIHSNKDLYNSLRDVINSGADMFNLRGDHAGCYRLYQGALLATRPFVPPEVQKAINSGLAKAEQMPSMANRAFELRRVIDLVRTNGKGEIKNAEGKVGERECWGQISAWCDYSGPIGDKTVGLAIFADPKNQHPTCWHSRGYGLMAANPFGRAKSQFPAMKGKTDLVQIDKGGHLRLRYALLAHEGDTDAGQVADYYRRFTELGRKD